MIEYRDATSDDGRALAAMAARSFTDTFGSLYRASDLAAFLAASFGDAGLPSQIGDPDYAIHLACVDGAITGFAKLGPVAFPGDWPPDAIELHQLYVLGAHHGEGVGPALMEWALDTARTRGAGQMLLSVWIDNHRARRFYERHGFEEIGRYAFMVGEQADDDRIMRKML